MKRYPHTGLALRTIWRRIPLLPLALLLFIIGCTQAIPMEAADRQISDDPNNNSGNGGDEPIVIPDGGQAPTISIVAPKDGSAIDSADVTIRGTASDDNGLSSVFVKIGRNTAVPAQSDDGFKTWYVDGIAPYGAFEVRAWAWDIDGQRSEKDSVIELERLGQSGDSLAPRVTITSPEDGSSPLHPVIVISGTTEDDGGVVRMTLSLNDVQQEEVAFDTVDQFAHWSRTTTLIPGAENNLQIRAYDAHDNVGTASLRLYAPAIDDRKPPTLEVRSPTDGSSINTGNLQVIGSATDNLGVREVKARSTRQQAGECDEDGWSSFTQATTEDAFLNFTVQLPVQAGEICVQVSAIDVSGLQTKNTLRLTNNYVPQWSEDITYLMRLHPQDKKPIVNLELTKDGLKDVMNLEIQKELRLAELDLEPVLFAALERIKSACGTWWKGTQGANNVSKYDCTVTDLGCSFGSGPSCTGWQSSPEYAMVRLLTMTPANGNIEGSSLGQMAAVVDAINRMTFGLIDSFADVIASTLKIGVNDTYVSTDAVVQALKEDLFKTHPSFIQKGDKYLLPVRLYDALNDLEPLIDVLGPASNGHPGIADPSFPTHGVVLPNDTFRMLLVAESNLRWHDGLQLGSGKNYISTIVDDVGPTFDDVMEFDFYDPTRFKIIGLPAEPTVDMRFSLYETPENISVCSDSSCKNHGPNNPRAGYVWALDPWALEHILVNSAYHTHTSLRSTTEYKAIFTLATVYVGQGGDPAGWLRMDVSGIAQSLTGSPPPPQFIWESIMDIAEVVGHRNVKPNRPSPACPNLGLNENEYTICEGDFNPSFTLYDVPTGVTAETLAEASRDQMNAQRNVLSQKLWGGYEENNGCVDFYYVQENGKYFLVETQEGDPLPQGCTVTSNGGFFADEALSDKVSSTNLSGVHDTTHQKWELSAGDHVLYKKGHDGHIWRLGIHVPDPSQPKNEISILVSHKL